MDKNFKHKIIHNNSKYPLIISFQGIDAGIYPEKKDDLSYLFYNLFTSSDLEYNYIFFKDIEQEIYGGCYDIIVNIIKEYISQYNPPTTYVMGQSVGGFTAIIVSEMLFNISVFVHKTIAFAPLTNTEWFQSYSDPWPLKINNIDIPCKKISELQPFNSSVQYWYPIFSKLDMWMIEYINESDVNLEIIKIKVDKHNIWGTIGKEKYKKLILSTISETYHSIVDEINNSNYIKNSNISNTSKII